MIKTGLVTLGRVRAIHVVFLAVVSLMMGCASAPKTHSLYDKDADFTSYKTYNFSEKLGTDQPGYSSLVTKYLKKSISEELNRRGYVESNDPNLIVNFYINRKDKTKVTSVPSPQMGISYGRGYYGYRSGFYSTWSHYDHETRVTQYEEGTLNIDLVDAKERQLVWEGVAVARIPSDILEDLDQKVEKVVKEVFVQYPFVAGG